MRALCTSAISRSASRPTRSPVTEADVRCEIAIREILEARFPAHGFFGEETGSRDAQAESLWLVDPIDGTKAFVREYPMFSTQIALMRRGEIVLGVSSAPVYGELSFAERGCGAYLNGKRLAVSEIAALEAAALSSGNMKTLASGQPMGAIWRARCAGQPHSRLRGLFCTITCWRAGKIDAVIESDVNILDIAACVAIVTEAGGRFTDLSGAPDHAADRPRCSQPMGDCMRRCWRRWPRAARAHAW